MPHEFDTPESVMRRALQLAAQGEGHVEPNPMVGAVVVDNALRLLGEGYHQQYGGPHAEIHALRQAGERARGATLYVTLEPCCHHGKTPPCTDAILAAGIKHVVVAARDPFPAVSGKGFDVLRAAGVTVEIGLLQGPAEQLTAPFRTLIQQQRPFVIAKWAMSLDGKLAAHTGISKWISNEASRAVVHQLRQRVDGILIGIGTALADDPQLTARPSTVETMDSPTPQPARIATRIVIDSHARLPLDGNLARTARDIPTLVFTTPAAPTDRVAALQNVGVEVVAIDAAAGQHPDLLQCLRVLGQRRMTNILVEGGSGILGSLFDQHLIDEAHIFVAPILIGGSTAPSPLSGRGVTSPEFAAHLVTPRIETLAGDTYITGRVNGTL